MVRFNDKTIISSLANNDILPLTDISESGDDKKVTVQMLSQYTVDNISTLSGGQSLTDNNLTNTLKSNYDTSYDNMLHGIALWGSLYTYAKNALVKTQTGSELPKLWYSLIDNNTGNNPIVDDGTHWAIYNIGGANTDLSNLSSLGEAHFQAPLVSGTNIKTINSTSLLGSDNLDLATSTLSNVSSANMLSAFRNSGQIYLKTTYVKGTSGYNIWSNGYCEQWGKASSSNITVTLLKVFINTNYNVQLTKNRSNSAYGPSSAYNLTSSSFEPRSNDDTGDPVFWKACGYLASGQY